MTDVDRVAPEELVEAWATLDNLQKHRHSDDYHGRGILRPDACYQCSTDVVRQYIARLEGENERLRTEAHTVCQIGFWEDYRHWWCVLPRGHSGDHSRTALSNSTKEGTDG